MINVPSPLRIAYGYLHAFRPQNTASTGCEGPLDDSIFLSGLEPIDNGLTLVSMAVVEQADMGFCRDGSGLAAP